MKTNLELLETPKLLAIWRLAKKEASVRVLRKACEDEYFTRAEALLSTAIEYCQSEYDCILECHWKDTHEAVVKVSPTVLKLTSIRFSGDTIGIIIYDITAVPNKVYPYHKPYHASTIVVFRIHIDNIMHSYGIAPKPSKEQHSLIYDN